MASSSAWVSAPVRSWTSTLTRFNRRVIFRITKPTSGPAANAISVSCQLIHRRYASMKAIVSVLRISTVTASEAVAEICCASYVIFESRKPADDAS